MFKEHLQTFRDGLVPGVDEVDVVLQVAYRHAGKSHPGEEYEPPYRHRAVPPMPAAVPFDLHEPGTFVVAQGVRGEVEHRRHFCDRHRIGGIAGVGEAVDDLD